MKLQLTSLVVAGLLGLTGVMGPLGLAAEPAAAGAAVDAFAVTESGTSLVTVSTAAPSAASTPKPFSGLQAGEKIVGIDVRPRTGQLYGLGSTSRLYLIDPVTAVTSAVGPAFVPALSGARFGFDFNPVSDQIRVTGSGGSNIRLNPDTGALLGTDGGLGINSVPVGSDAVAFTSSAGVASGTTQYNLTSGALWIPGPPGAANLQLVGAFGVVTDVGAPMSFDILVAGSRHEAFATLVGDGFPGLYSINLATGAATLIGVTNQIFAAFALAGPTGYCGADFDAQVVCTGPAGGGRPSIPGLVDDVVDAVQTPSGLGVWQVAFDGGVFASGDAEFFGSVGGTPLAAEVVGLAPTPTGRGYWLVAADGGVFAFGDAGFFGSVPGVLAPGQTLNAVVVGIVGTPSGRGYWMVAADGGIFSFGDAPFLGSVPAVLAPGQSLVASVIGIARNEVGRGYYMVALDGGVFAFGAPFLGSAGGLPLVAPVTDIASAGPGGGYRIFGADGGIFTYGGASFQGAIPEMDFGVGLAG